MAPPCILVLHGITMSGSSMQRQLGPIRDALEAAGFQLLYPEGAHIMSEAELSGFLQWVNKRYAKRNQDAEAVFTEGVFWEGAHHDWFNAKPIPDSREQDFSALEDSLSAIRAMAQDHHIVGLLGFSQGCAMAGVLAGLATRGGMPFSDSLRFGVFLSGFKSVFKKPDLKIWPVNDLPGLFIGGNEDAIFPKPATLQALADEFTNPELHRVDGLPHTPPSEPEWVKRIVDFATKHVGTN